MLQSLFRRDDTPSNDGQPSILAKTRHLVKANGSILGSEVAKTIEPLYPTFTSAIPRSSTVALASIDGRSAISHERVHDFCASYFGPALHRLGFGSGHRVALVLPNGPELALCIVATANWATSVPLSANGAPAELEEDLLRCGADLVIGPYTGDFVDLETDGVDIKLDSRFCVMESAGKANAILDDYKVFSFVQASAEKLNIPFVGLVPSPFESGIFRLVVPKSMPKTPLSLHFKDDKAASTVSVLPPLHQGRCKKEPNKARDEVLVLFTSGTTGNKKLVPHQLGDMLTAATTIALSWDLTPADVNCNLMPLFHVGGIVRQIFSPFISGSAVICCPSFDPSIFWALLAKKSFTWYYAAPTMHQLILQSHDPEQCPSPKLRMIANAAGGLLPSLAIQLRNSFQQATVLPSYGMTECMPISSPPATYDLSKPGTSGVAVGPEVAIMNLESMEPLQPGQEGPICVRGEPCFRGYGKIATNPDEPSPPSFLEGGWFNTGDLGYLDKDGYLYITGRSKEVINRGGEIISPMEVEESVTAHPRVKACAAFSANHDVLQEVVGIVIVMESGHPRIDLKELHSHLSTRLAQPKWPQCLVFLDGLPKNNTNKLLRTNLGTRFGLPELSDTMTTLQRTYEGTCPPQGASLKSPIPVASVSVSAAIVESKLKSALGHHKNGAVKVVQSSERSGALVCYLSNIDRKEVAEIAPTVLDGYAVPSYFVLVKGELNGKSTLPEPKSGDALENILNSSSSTEELDPVTRAVQNLFVRLLDLDYTPAPHANFFNLGGSSMLASQLASKIRKEFGISCAGAEIFHHPSIADLAQLVRKRGSAEGHSDASSDLASPIDGLDDHGAAFHSKRLPPSVTWWAMLVQLMPMFVVFPVWQVSRYLLFFAVLLRTLDVVPSDRNVGTFIMAYLAFHVCWITITPLVFVAIKWVVIGRYRPGRYPIWSSYYLRWWFVDICRQLFLRGIWGSSEEMLNFYYRLLGANIGEGARISLEADIAEFDLVTVGDYAAVEMSTLRGFGIDNGAMFLAEVKVGRNASVGIRSVVAPGTSIPDNSHLGPATSSYDVGALNDSFAQVNRQLLPEPSFMLQTVVAGPLSFAVNCFSQIPPFLILFWMVACKSLVGEGFDTPSDLMQWLCARERIPFYIGIRVARAILSPFFYMAGALTVKYFFIGKFEAGPRNNHSEWELLRYHLAARLFSRSKIQAVVDIIGRHYELVSCLYRLLGAKIGKRVFWPGHQPVFSGAFEMIEIGDDVVFGSRSIMFTTTVTSSEKVVLCAGSNVSDNCVVLPGTIVGKGATLGSNSVAPEGCYLPEKSVWFGSRGGKPTCLERGSESFTADLPTSKGITVTEKLLEGDSSTLRPFGKAIYKREATYFSWPVAMMAALSASIKVFCAIFHSLSLLLSIHAAALILYGPIWVRDYGRIQYNFFTVYVAVLFSYFWVNILRVFTWLLIEISAKWTLIGRRQEGTYNYDTSSYGQRWELYQLICKIRKFSRFNFLQFFFGTPYMNYYFRLNGGNVGRDVCLYPTGADPFMPEPDLVTIGDRCVIDCASMVCHLNTRGKFDLAKITIENDCTLRCRSRVQQGVYMEAGSQLLEKSVAMTGEALEEKSVWVGCPATPWFHLTSDKTINSGDDETSSTETSELLKNHSSPNYGV